MNATADISVGAGHVVGVCFTVLLIGLCAGFMGGWAVHGWRDAKTLEAGRAKAITATAQENARRARIDQDYARSKRANEVFYERDPNWWLRWSNAHPDLAACDIGADGLRDWNSWNQGSPAGRTAGSAGTVPAASAGDELTSSGSGGKPSADDAALSRLRGPTTGAGAGGQHP